jgi:aryl-alcohol dehydrogenase-like predicted oxidoreductase
MNEAISVVIPGAKNAEQARANIGAAALAPLSPETMAHSIDLRNKHQALGASALVNA